MTDKNSRIAVDPEALRARYEQERDKRLRASGTDQYVFAEGRFAQFDADPHAGEPVERPALDEETDVLVIGAGLGGLQAAITLTKHGVTDIRIIDIAGDFGGAWYWNRYPGLRCDVDSYVYLPFLEDTGYIPTERYARGSEILEYCRKLGRDFGLYDRALFQTKITAMCWDETRARWIVTTSRGDTLKARFVTTQSGAFNRPQLPGIEGIDRFRGRSFHSARWDYDYTGGDCAGNLDKLGDKRVGIIGTGATGVQVVPEIARVARSLTVFQRTPTAVAARENGPTDEAWFRSQSPGWHRHRQKSFTQIKDGINVDCPIDDGWTRFFRSLIAAKEALPEAERTPENLARAQEIADLEHNEMLRARVDRSVRDPAKAELLKAWYRTMCKRMGFSDDYLPAFDRDNADLVDVSGGIDCITENGVMVDGVEHALDCIIYCTGFELGTAWVHQAGYDVIGRNGLKLSDKWALGLKTYHGLFSHGFPNIFFMGITQTGLGTSIPYALGQQADHLAYVIRHCLKNGFRTVETTQAAEAGWQKVMAQMNEIRRPFQEACTPGYFNAEGKPEDQRNTTGSGVYFPATEFFDNWETWREQGDLEGLVLST